MSITTPAIGQSSSQRRTAILAGVIGNVLEWYDFAVYGYFVPVISQLFFPNQTPLVSLLLTFSVFGVGFVMRPLGAVVFGQYGDRHGRKRALSAVIFLMAASTFAVGLLPTYASIGVLAPLLLVVARLAQGLSGGGEWGGAAAYLVEYALPGKRGLTGSWQQVSVGCGFLLGSLTAAVLTTWISPTDMLAWGWRIPFLLGVLVGAVGAVMRWRLDDTPKFAELENQGKVARSPLREAFTTFRRPTLIAFGITLHNTVGYYAGADLPDHLADQHRQDAARHGAVDRHRVPSRLRRRGPGHGGAVRPRRPPPIVHRVLRRLHRPGVSAVPAGLDGSAGLRLRGTAHPRAAASPVCRAGAGSVLRAVPHPSPLHRPLGRLQHPGRDLRRLCAVHRDLADPVNRQPFIAAFYVIAASLVTLVTMVWVKETAFEPLK